MSNSISDLNTAGVANSSAKLDGIQFNKIQKTGYNSVAKYVLADTPWYTLNPSTSVKPAVNAVDIDWNEAVIPYGNLETGDSVTVNSTGELLSLISRMQQEIYHTYDSIHNSTKNFYDDLVSNKKVYIENAPVFYYNITNDTNAKTIIAYTFANHYGVPYAINYEILITITSDGVWEVQDYLVFDNYNFFNPTVILEVDSTSTTKSRINICAGDISHSVPIDNVTMLFVEDSNNALAKVNVENKYTYWKLDGFTGSKGSYADSNFTRYMYRIDNNKRYSISITYNSTDKTITTLATLME